MIEENAKTIRDRWLNVSHYISAVRGPTFTEFRIKCRKPFVVYLSVCQYIFAFRRHIRV